MRKKLVVGKNFHILVYFSAFEVSYKIALYKSTVIIIIIKCCFIATITFVVQMCILNTTVANMVSIAHTYTQILLWCLLMGFITLFWPRLCLTILHCSARCSVSCLIPNAFLFIVNCSCSPGILLHFSLIHS